VGFKKGLIPKKKKIHKSSVNPGKRKGKKKEKGANVRKKVEGIRVQNL